MRLRLCVCLSCSSTPLQVVRPIGQRFLTSNAMVPKLAEKLITPRYVHNQYIYIETHRNKHFIDFVLFNLSKIRRSQTYGKAHAQGKVVIVKSTYRKERFISVVQSSQGHARIRLNLLSMELYWLLQTPGTLRMTHGSNSGTLTILLSPVPVHSTAKGKSLGH